MTKLILPASARKGKPERVGLEVRGDDRGHVLLHFERPIQDVIYTPQEAATIAQALARAAQDQAKHGGDPLKGVLIQ